MGHEVGGGVQETMSTDTTRQGLSEWEEASPLLNIAVLS